LGSIAIARFGELAFTIGFKISGSKQQFSEIREEDSGLPFVDLQIFPTADSGGNRFFRFANLEGNKIEVCVEPG
jgi:hypothetical protein